MFDCAVHLAVAAVRDRDHGVADVAVAVGVGQGGHAGVARRRQGHRRPDGRRRGGGRRWRGSGGLHLQGRRVENSYCRVRKQQRKKSLVGKR